MIGNLPKIDLTPTIIPPPSSRPDFGAADPFKSSAPPPTGGGPAYGKMKIETGINKRALVKLFLFLVIIGGLGIVSTVSITRLFTTQVYQTSKNVLISAPFKITVWQSFGSVPEAEIELPLQSLQGVVKHAFLLDTGAVVSSLPREMAETLGFNLAFLPRQTFRGFGNTTSFAYEAEMNVALGQKAIKLPVVFTEASGSKSLLGRKGLFDKFTIVVDHKNQVVEIRE